MQTILLLHGALGASGQLKTLKEALEPEGFSVLSLDFSGHGGRPFKSDLGIEIFSQELREVVEQQGLPKINLFGYSMGGYVALWFAFNFPEHAGKIVTLGTKFDWSEKSAEKEIQKLNPEKIIEKVPGFARLLESRHKPNDWKLLMSKTSAMMSALGSNPILTPERLKLIKSETLVLLGDADDMADRKYSQEVAHMLPKGHFRLLPETPHAIEKINVPILAGVLSQYFNS